MGQLTTPRPARLTRPTHAQNPGTDASTGGRGGEAPGGAATDDPSRSGSADGIGFRVGDWNCGTFSLRQANRQLCRTGSHGRVQRRSAPIGTHQQARQLTASLFAGRSGAGYDPQPTAVAQQVLPSCHASRTQDRQSRNGPQTGGVSVLDVAPGVGLRTVAKARFRTRESPEIAMVCSKSPT